MSIFEPSFWLVVGFTGQALFTMRFLIQWIASEKKRDSVMPTAFWWLSLFGGGLLLVYSISRRDPVIMFGQSMGVIVYVRNLMLVAKRKRRTELQALQAKARDRAQSPHFATSGSESHPQRAV